MQDIPGNIGQVGLVKVDTVGVVFNNQIVVDMIDRAYTLQEDTGGKASRMIVYGIGEDAINLRVAIQIDARLAVVEYCIGRQIIVGD